MCFSSVTTLTDFVSRTLRLTLVDTAVSIFCFVGCDSVTSEGRAAVVRCYGVSTGKVCPPTSDQNVDQPQFCKETSMSDPM